jgi:hypothetical protein
MVIPVITFTDDHTFHEDVYITPHVTPVTDMISLTANAFEKITYALTLWYGGYRGSIRRPFVMCFDDEGSIHKFRHRIKTSCKELMKYTSAKYISIKGDSGVVISPTSIHAYSFTIIFKSVRSVPV